MNVNGTCFLGRASKQTVIPPLTYTHNNNSNSNTNTNREEGDMNLALSWNRPSLYGVYSVL